MAKTQHKKLKNTGILFELLTKQITSDILSERKTNSTDILKKYFNSHTELGKELYFYQSLITDKFSNYKDANALINTVMESVSRINNNKLKEEKYNLIGELKRHYSIKEFLKSKIPNYTLLASIYKLVEYNKGRHISPKEIVESKNFLINHILTKKVETKQEESEYEQLSEDLRLLTYKLIVDKFNDKYTVLDENQKDVLKHYINNISNSVKLKEYIEKKILDIKVKLTNLLPEVSNKQLKVKLEQLNEQMYNNFKGATSTDTHILNIMRYYQIINDLNDINNEQ